MGLKCVSLSLVAGFFLLPFAGVGLDAGAQQATSNLPTMAANGYKDVRNNPSLILSLDLIRQMPSVLDKQAGLLNSFIVLNICHNPEVAKELGDEFEAPSIKAYYKSHATEILAGAPMTYTASILLGLGEYDLDKQDFPFTTPDSNGHYGTISLDHVGYQSNTPVQSCKLLFSGYGSNWGYASYRVEFKPITISVIPMAESTARKYVESLPDPHVRNVLFSMQVEIEPKAPKIEEPARGRPLVTFEGRIVGMTITKGSDPGGAVLTTLNPAEVTAAPAASASAPVTPASPLTGGMQSESQQNQAAASPAQGKTMNAPVPHPGIVGRAFSKELAKCNAGDGGACDHTGFDLANGWGVDRNLAMAKRFYEKSCAMGSRHGCFDAKNAPGN